MDERNDAVRTQEEDRVTTPYCFVAAMYEGKQKRMWIALTIWRLCLKTWKKSRAGKSA